MVSHAQTYVFHASDEPLEEKRCSIPTLESGEILVEILLTTICKSDINTYIGVRIETTPSILGHEIVGKIVGLAPFITDTSKDSLTIGDVICWSIFAAPHDNWSQNGLPQKSPQKIKYGHEKTVLTLSGGFASHIILRPGTEVRKIEQPIDPKILAPANCSLATMVGAFRMAGPCQDKQIAILGSGMLGIQGCAYVTKKLGGIVTMFDLVEKRLNQARLFGASNCVLLGMEDIKNHADQFDIVIDTSGSLQAMDQTLGLSKIGGTIVWVGGVFPQDSLSLDTELVIRKILSLKGLHNYNREDFHHAIDYLTEHYQVYPYEQLVEKVFPLTDIEKAFQYAIYHNPLRVGLTP